MTDTIFPKYEDMVRKLFKRGLPGNHADLLHAAIGMAGESGELREATDRKNVLEELGDLTFYAVAARLYLNQYVSGDMPSFPPISGWNETVNKPLCVSLDDLHVVTSAFLDQSKKLWIYNRKITDKMALDNLCDYLHSVESCIVRIERHYGFTKADTHLANKIKLLGTPEQKGRYASGQYSDEQALARADKTEQGGEHF